MSVELPESVARWLALLDERGDVENVLCALADHAAQGVYRPGAWERPWIEQVFYPGEWHGRLAAAHRAGAVCRDEALGGFGAGDPAQWRRFERLLVLGEGSE